MVTATPSGGWLQSSPVVPGLGFPLNSRAQMFWLEDGLPGSLAPGKRPRTTLSPSLALDQGRPAMVFGTPGGDQQDQWQTALFLRRVHHKLNLQEAIDLPLFHTAHFPASFYPRGSRPGHLLVEESVGEGTLAELARLGHLVERAPAWSAGRLTAAEKGRDGILRAAATPVSCRPTRSGADPLRQHPKRPSLSALGRGGYAACGSHPRPSACQGGPLWHNPPASPRVRSGEPVGPPQ